MPEHRDDDFSLALSIECALDSADVEMEHITFIYGTIVRHTECGPDEAVGTTTAYLVDFVRAQEESSTRLIELLDYEADTAQYMQVAGSGPGLVEELDARFPLLTRLLLFDRIEIQAMYRGRNLGLWVLRRLMEMYASGGDTLPLLIPYPLQFSTHDDHTPTTVDLTMYHMSRDEAFSKLSAHWAKAGFEPLYDCGEYEIWAFDVDRTEPRWSEILI